LIGIVIEIDFADSSSRGLGFRVEDEILLPFAKADFSRTELFKFGNVPAFFSLDFVWRFSLIGATVQARNLYTTSSTLHIHCYLVIYPLIKWPQNANPVKSRCILWTLKLIWTVLFSISHAQNVLTVAAKLPFPISPKMNLLMRLFCCAKRIISKDFVKEVNTLTLSLVILDI
jgi:hypothetical protein